MRDLAKLGSLAEWPKDRAGIEKAVVNVLGSMPKERVELQVKTVDETSFAGYVRKRVTYFVDNWSRAAAWLFVPEGKEDVPAILCCHRTVPQGKDESAGIEGDLMLAFAQHFAELGYITLAPDCITAGDRVSSGLDPFDTKQFYSDFPKMSALGKMLCDHVLAVDLLCETRGGDPERVAVIGHGLGATNALFLAAMDERVQVCVASCGFTRFADDKDAARWARPDGFVHLPKLKEAIKRKKFPFDWEHILALIAPSPVLLLTALNDAMFPNTQSCAKATRLAGNVYKLLNENGAIANVTHRDGHGMTEEAVDKADEWIERWL